MIIETLTITHTMAHFVWLWNFVCYFYKREFGQIWKIWVILELKSLQDKANSRLLSGQARALGWINSVPWLEGLRSEDMALARAPVAGRAGRTRRDRHSFFLVFRRIYTILVCVI